MKDEKFPGKYSGLGTLTNHTLWRARAKRVCHEDCPGGYVPKGSVP